MTEYTTREGDAIDEICYLHYGHEHGTTEVVLQENPTLSAHGAVLPAGITVLLPELVQPAPVVEQVSLWD